MNMAVPVLTCASGWSAVYFRGADGLMLVFDVTSKESFENIRNWMTDINKHVEKASVQKILVGNKADVSQETGADSVRLRAIHAAAINNQPVCRASVNCCSFMWY